jgi:hypothetical protein
MNSTCLCASLLAFTLFSTTLPAQETQPSSVEVSTGGAGVASKKKHAVSTDVSKSVTSAFQYNPPPPPKPEAEQVDLREIDKPRNEIIRLPKYMVEAKRPPVFNDRNLYSQEMLRRLAYKRYASAFSRDVLNRYQIFGKGDEAYAMMQYEAEERRQNMAEMADKVSMYRISGDKEEANQLKQDAQNTFMRRTDFGPTQRNIQSQ